MKKAIVMIIVVFSVMLSGCGSVKTAEEERDYKVYTSFRDTMWRRDANGDVFTYKKVFEVVTRDGNDHIIADFKTRDLEPYWWCNETGELIVENTEVNMFAPFAERYTFIGVAERVL